MKIQAITICVNYADILEITLPRMLEHFERVTVVTSLTDTETWDVVEINDGANLFCTESFYKNGSKFNKGAAMDEALADVARESGWKCIIDADIYLPTQLDLFSVQPGYLYSPYRRILEKSPIKGDLPSESEWCELPEGWERRNNEYAGYFQLFHTDDPRFGAPPWYERDKWTTARGCDSEFFYRWLPNNLIRIESFEVLHLGPMKVNWEGRQSPSWRGVKSPS